MDDPEPDSTSEASSWPLRLAVAGMAMVGWTGFRTADFAVADWVFLATAVLTFAKILTGGGRAFAPRQARRSSPLLLVGLGLLTIGGLLGTFVRSVDPYGSALVLLRLWYISVVWFWTLRTVCTTWRHFRLLLIAFVGGELANAVAAIWQEVTGTNQATYGRSDGFTDHFNALGTAVAAAVPLVVVWRTQNPRSGLAKGVHVGFVLLLLGGVGVSGSLTAFAAAVVGSVVSLAVPWFVSSSRTSRRRMGPGVLVAVVVTLVVGSGALSLSVTERFTNYVEGNNRYVNGSVAVRGELNDVAIASIIESPLIGTGFDRKSSEIEVQGRPRSGIHSLYYKLLYEAGVLGFIGMLAIFVLAAHQALSMTQYMRGKPGDWMPIGLLGSMVVLWADAVYSPPLFERFFWAPFALIGVAFGLCRSIPLPESKEDRSPSVAVRVPLSRQSYRSPINATLLQRPL
jgi:hypothetical protein